MFFVCLFVFLAFTEGLGSPGQKKPKQNKNRILELNNNFNITVNQDNVTTV